MSLKIEKPSLIKVSGILTALTGVLIIIDISKASFSSQTTIGDILIVLNSISYGAYVAISKPVMLRQGALKSVTWIFIFASLICTPIGAIQLFKVDLSEVPTHIWFLVAYISIFATCIPYILNAMALSKVNPSSVAAYIYLQPLIGFLSAMIFLNETANLTTVTGAILVLIGIFITTRKDNEKTSLIKVSSDIGN
jgi:drug/metabolite transporter (DMT)-like permease